jgi:hypothetical protein
MVGTARLSSYMILVTTIISGLALACHLYISADYDSSLFSTQTLKYLKRLRARLNILNSLTRYLALITSCNLAVQLCFGYAFFTFVGV